MKRVLVYGTFDYFHYGHYNFLKQAKSLGDYLIVGVSSDNLCLKKGKSCILNQRKRVEIIKSLKFVDKVIIENDFSQKIYDAQKYKIDIYADGEDYIQLFPKTKEYSELKKMKIEIVFLKRTRGISTSNLKTRLKKQMLLDKNKNSLRNKTKDIG